MRCLSVRAEKNPQISTVLITAYSSVWSVDAKHFPVILTFTNMDQSRQKVSQAATKLKFDACFAQSVQKRYNHRVNKRGFMRAADLPMPPLSLLDQIRPCMVELLHESLLGCPLQPANTADHAAGVWRNARWTQQEIHAARRPGPSQTGPFTRKWGKQDVRSLKDTAFGPNFCKLQRIVCKTDSRESAVFRLVIRGLILGHV